MSILMLNPNDSLAEFAMIPNFENFGLSDSGVHMYSSGPQSEFTICYSTSPKLKQWTRTTGPQMNVDDARVRDALKALFHQASSTGSKSISIDKGQWALISTWGAVAKEMGLRGGASHSLKNELKIKSSFDKMLKTTYQTGDLGSDSAPGADGRSIGFCLIPAINIFKADHPLKESADFKIMLDPASCLLLTRNENGGLLVSNNGQYAHQDRVCARACTNDTAYLIHRRLSHQLKAGESKTYSIDSLASYCRGSNLTALQRRHTRSTIIESGIPQIQKLAGWKVVRDKNMFTFTRPKKEKNK